MEMLSLVASLVHRFDFTLADPTQEWEIVGQWFTQQSKMDMTFTPRKA